ncbi:hypothetical protein SMICM304S_09289 [Streptomyces microflavus]
MGWLRAVMGGNTWTVAQFPVEARQEVFSAPSSRVALQLRLAGPPARRVPEGYLLRGMWGRFCSGIDHAEWIVAGVSAPPAPGAEPEPHVVLWRGGREATGWRRERRPEAPTRGEA